MPDDERARFSHPDVELGTLPARKKPRMADDPVPPPPPPPPPPANDGPGG